MAENEEAVENHARKRRRKKSLKRRLESKLRRSKTRDTVLYIIAALILGFAAGMMILRYIGE